MLSPMTLASPRLTCRTTPPIWISPSPITEANASHGAIPVNGGRIRPTAPRTSRTPTVRTSPSGTLSTQAIIGRNFSGDCTTLIPPAYMRHPAIRRRSIEIDAGTKGTSVSPTHREVPVSRYEDVCLIRGDQGRAIRALLDRIADKWTLLIIATLHDGRLRFTQLQRHIPGISQRMLSLTLRNLERDGLVIRTVFAEVPPRVQYELTKTANTLIPHAVAWPTGRSRTTPRSMRIGPLTTPTRPPPTRKRPKTHQVSEPVAEQVGRRDDQVGPGDE